MECSWDAPELVCNFLLLVLSHLWTRDIKLGSHIGMHHAIQTETSLLDVIQAGCLISLYLYFKGRVLEGYVMGASVSRLAVACGLHQIKPRLLMGINGMRSKKGGSDVGKDGEEVQELKVDHPVGLTLPEPNSLAELGDRMHTFWQVSFCFFFVRLRKVESLKCEVRRVLTFNF